MKTPAPGNVLLRGESGIVFEAPIRVASGVIRNSADVKWVGGEWPDDVPGKPTGDRAPAEVTADSEPGDGDGEEQDPAPRRRGGRQPKKAADSEPGDGDESAEAGE